MTALSPSLSANPRLDCWIDLAAAGRVSIRSGKVEMGQGIVTALAQIAAEELDVALDRIDIVSGDSVRGPNEGYTASSWTIEHSGSAIRQVCAEVRALALDAAGGDAVSDGTILSGGRPTGQDYWSLAHRLNLMAEVSGRAVPKPRSDYRLVGHDIARHDLPAKVFGGGFIQDIAEPGMLHARALRAPGRDAVLVELDEDRIRRVGGDVRIVRRGNFVAAVGESETGVERAAVVAESAARWEGARTLRAEQATAGWIAAQPSDDRIFGDPGGPPAGNRVERFTATRGFLSHGSIAPSCALARFQDGQLTVWSHGQGMHALRAAIAKTLGMDPSRVACFHVQGAGCYGHNGADDAALDAAVIALEVPGHLIRLQWRRTEEFRYEPLSPAMKVEVRAVLDDSGAPVDWTTEIWSPTHGARPGIGGATLLGAEALENPPGPRAPFDVPEDRGGGATRNGAPLYDLPQARIVHHLIHDCPVRTSSLRGLGATLNVFAIEGLIDRLAATSGADPLDFRLSLLGDARARDVLTAAAEAAGWASRGAGGTGRGMGLGLARYKNRAAYAAVVATVDVDEAVKVRTVHAAVDAGLVINPDGLRNQIEGNIVQAISWTLIEQVAFGEGRIASDTWETYPVIRFSDVPDIAVQLMTPPDDAPSLGVGECAGGPTAAAIGNAVAHALGRHVADLPLTRDRIMSILLEQEP